MQVEGFLSREFATERLGLHGAALGLCGGCRVHAGGPSLLLPHRGAGGEAEARPAASIRRSGSKLVTGSLFRGVPSFSILNPGIRIFSRKPPETRGKRQVFEKNMIEKNGELSPGLMVRSVSSGHRSHPGASYSLEVSSWT